MAKRMIPKRVINFANLPLKLMMPKSLTDIREIAIKTIPSATKIEIKRVLESMYGFEVDRVHTLNMAGKKKRIGRILMCKPDYKKAYVTLLNPLSISPDLFPIPPIQAEKERIMSKRSTSSMVESEQRKSHWLEGQAGKAVQIRKIARYGRAGWVNQCRRDGRYGRYARGALFGQIGWDGYLPRRDNLVPDKKTGANAEEVKFPWSNLRSTR